MVCLNTLTLLDANDVTVHRKRTCTKHAVIIMSEQWQSQRISAVWRNHSSVPFFYSTIYISEIRVAILWEQLSVLDLLHTTLNYKTTWKIFVTNSMQESLHALPPLQSNSNSSVVVLLHSTFRGDIRTKLRIRPSLYIYITNSVTSCEQIHAHAHDIAYKTSSYLRHHHCQ